MTDSDSPRRKPRAACPSAKSRTWSWYSCQVWVCQMPRSSSLIARRPPRTRALCCRSRGSVVTSSPGCAMSPSLARLGIAQVRLDHPRVGPNLVRGALRDLLSHVEHHHPVRDIHDHPHVVPAQDDGRPPLLVHVQDVAGHVLLLLVIV